MNSLVSPIRALRLCFNSCIFHLLKGIWQKAVTRRVWAEHGAGEQELHSAGPCSLLWPEATCSMWLHSTFHLCKVGEILSPSHNLCKKNLKMLLEHNGISSLETPRIIHLKQKYWLVLRAPRCAVTGGFAVDDTIPVQVTGGIFGVLEWSTSAHRTSLLSMRNIVIQNFAPQFFYVKHERSKVTEKPNNSFETGHGHPVQLSELYFNKV